MKANNFDSRASRRALLGAAVLGAGFVAGGGSSFIARMGVRHRGQFLPGARVGGVDVSGKTADEAAALFERRWREYLAAPVIFRAPDRDWTPSAAEIGIAVDYLTPLRRAYAWGREGGIFRRARENTAAVAIERNWPVEFTFDQAVLRRYLVGVASLYYQPAASAGVELRDGEILFRPSSTGIALDWESAFRLVRPPGPEAGPQAIVIPIKEVHPPFATEQADDVVKRIESLVKEPLVLAFEGSGWLVDQETLRAALVLSQVGENLFPIFDNAKFGPLFDEIEQRLAIKPLDGLATFDAEKQRVTEFRPANDGRTLDRVSLQERILAGAAFDRRTIDIPMVGLTASHSPLAALGIEELIATGESFFKDSPSYRIHNIEAGSALLNGVLIKPGEVFSFSKYLGPVEYKRGFVDGLVIIEDKTTKAIGGGICQVSTTMFRAAFWAGLPIEERHKHLYRVRYYEQGNFPIGFDAAIWQPALDLRYENDTGAPLMIRTDFNRKRSQLKFELWGRKPNREVEIADHRLSDWKDELPDEWVVDEKLPEGTTKQTEWAVKGVFAVLTRRVKSGPKVLSETEFASSFVPWPNRYAVSPDVAQATQPEAYQKWLERKAQEAQEGEEGAGDDGAKVSQTSGY